MRLPCLVGPLAVRNPINRGKKRQGGTPSCGEVLHGPKPMAGARVHHVDDDSNRRLHCCVAETHGRDGDVMPEFDECQDARQTPKGRRQRGDNRSC